FHRSITCWAPLAAEARTHMVKSVAIAVDGSAMAVLAMPSASALESSFSLIDFPPNGVRRSRRRSGVRGKAFPKDFSVREKVFPPTLHRIMGLGKRVWESLRGDLFAAAKKCRGRASETPVQRRFSPASMRKGRIFSGGGSGQTACSVKAQGGLIALLKSRTMVLSVTSSP